MVEQHEAKTNPKKAKENAKRNECELAKELFQRGIKKERAEIKARWRELKVCESDCDVCVCIHG